MAKTKVTRKVPFNFCMAPAMHAQLQKLAAKREQSIATLIRRAVRQLLDKADGGRHAQET